jgi:aspartate racemase
MKVLGLIGGISWISTLDYYKLINEGINEKLGGLNSSKCIVYSFNYADIKENNDKNDWETTFKMVSEACHHLKNCGAEGIILCANTMHLIADRLQADISIPIIHIAEGTAKEIQTKGLKKVGLVGTRFTMEEDFFKHKLTDKGINVLIPDEIDRAFIHQTIFDELGKGIINESTKERYLSIIKNLINSGAEGIILGCTEIPLLIKNEDVDIPLFDTAMLHAKAAIEFSLETQ